VAEPAGGTGRKNTAGGAKAAFRENSGLAHDRRYALAHAPFGADRAAQRRAIRHAKSVGRTSITSALCVPIVSHRGHAGICFYADRLGGVSFAREDQELADGRVSACGAGAFELQRLEDALTEKRPALNELKIRTTFWA